MIALASLAVSQTSYAADAAWPKKINLGYQKYGTLIILKSTGELEKRLNERAVTGETPLVFAQASKNSPLVYVANEPASPQGEGIVVKADSGLKSVGRSNYGPEHIKPEVTAAQQKIADTLFDIKLLPKPIKVEDAVWQPKK